MTSVVKPAALAVAVGLPGNAPGSSSSLVEAAVDVHGADAACGTLPAALKISNVRSFVFKCKVVNEELSLVIAKSTS